MLIVGFLLKAGYYLDGKSAKERNKGENVPCIYSPFQRIEKL